MKSENIIVSKTFDLAVHVLQMCKELQSAKKEFIVSNQFMRSVTSIGAMVREAQEAESKQDFIHKLSVALKEARESSYWFDLLIATNTINKEDAGKIDELLKETTGILTAIIKTTKANLKKLN